MYYADAGSCIRGHIVDAACAEMSHHCKHCDEAYLTVESALEAGYTPAGDCLKSAK